MTRLTRRAGLGAILALAGSGLASAHDMELGALRITGAWSRAAPKGRTGAGYLTIRNTGTTPDRLVSASTPISPMVELHRHMHDNGVMRMREVEGGIEIPAGGSVTLEPGGMHLMLMDLAEPLRQGGTVPITLVFEKAGTVQVQLAVQSAGARTPAAHQH